MLATHSPGTSFLHRMRAGAKLAGLALLALALVLFPQPEVSGSIAVLLIGLALFTRVAWRAIAVPVTAAAITSGILALFHLYFTGAQAAIRVATSLFSLVLAASLVTATTPLDRMLDLLENTAAPVARLPLVRRTGFTAERFALAIAVMLRAIPVIFLITKQTREAAIARGLGRSPRAVIVPAIVRTVRHAQRTAEALAARGLD